MNLPEKVLVVTGGLGAVGLEVTQMTESKRFSFAALSAITLSSVTMLWLFWRFPIPTSFGSIVLLSWLLRCVRFAKLVDLAVGPD
jgi:hypothetical protein